MLSDGLLCVLQALIWTLRADPATFPAEMETQAGAVLSTMGAELRLRPPQASALVDRRQQSS